MFYIGINNVETTRLVVSTLCVFVLRFETLDRFIIPIIMGKRSTGLMDQLGRLCVCGTEKVTESSHKRKCTSSDSCGHWRQEQRSKNRLESELPTVYNSQDMEAT